MDGLVFYLSFYQLMLGEGVNKISMLVYQLF